MIVALLLAASANWPIYHNGRFGFAICYPPQFTPQPPPANDDGRAFVSPDGARLLAFGQLPAPELAQWAREEAIAYTSRARRITYDRGGNNWHVVSGMSGTGRVFYVRANARTDAFTAFHLSYPQRLARRYAALPAQLARCFRP